MIYLDNAATTPMQNRVKQAMLPYLQERFANPAAVYEPGAQNAKAVEHAREQIAKTLAVAPDELYFTAGGSESDNWMLQRIAETRKHPHIITSMIEHHAILNTCRYLQKKGCRVTYLHVDEVGRISLSELERAIDKDTVLISIMTANNEIGTIQPMEKIGAIAKKHGILFHTDAVQAYGHIPIQLKQWNVSALSASAHKFCGPKGCGFLYLKKEIPLLPLIYGGAQEHGKRAGTTNVPGIVGMGEAAVWADETLKERMKKETELREYLIQEVLRRIPYTRVNGARRERLPNNVSFTFQFVEGETLLVMLDMKGICASAASACSAGSKDVSHVLRATGMPEELARGTVRLTLSAENTKKELEYAVEVLEESVGQLRALSQEYIQYQIPQTEQENT
ncbi:MAG: cysteine desulfurase family protein [Lachnospiraceae bacterium]